jgi:hypothetical protein
MSDPLRNTPSDFARRLYALVPGNYRAYDAEEDPPGPLQALLSVIGTQAAWLHQDIDALWDNFFIETSDDWVVPYLAALVDTNLLPRADAHSVRLDTRNTVAWRRRKGTPAVLREVAAALSGWPTDRIAEFFASLGWSQNLNHLRLDHPLTADLRDPIRLGLLGHATDPFAHAADFRVSSPLDSPRVTPGSLGIGHAAWGTPGRYQIKQLGAFVHRLQTFRLAGVTPAAVDPGLALPADANCFTSAPLHRETPLFTEATGAPISRTAFEQAPWDFVGEELAVRQFSLLLTSDAAPAAAESGATAPRAWDLAAGPQPRPADPRVPFTFSGLTGDVTLDPSAGLRIMNPRAIAPGGPHFVISAEWWDKAASTATSLGAISTLTGAYVAGATAGNAGQLRLVVRTGRARLGFPGLPPSPPGRFPGAVVAVQRQNTGIPRTTDALYVTLPAGFVGPTELVSYVADDGATYDTSDLAPTGLQRGRYGDIYPARRRTASVDPADEFSPISRGPHGLRLPDAGRIGPAAFVVRAEVFTAGPPQVLGAIATTDQVISDHPELEGPDAWPARTYRRSLAVLANNVPAGKLALRLTTSGATPVPACELIVESRAGASLLVAIPELQNVPAGGQVLLVADDGSTWFAPADPAEVLRIVSAPSLDGLRLARASAGQVLPITGTFPLQHRTPVGLDLCACERRALLRPGELGIDPERGRFALAPGDPAEGSADLSVDYVEAFTELVGARTFPGRVDPAVLPTRLVARHGDAATPWNLDFPLDHIHQTVADALAAAGPNDVIEITDSATYPSAAPLTVKPNLATLTIRAAVDQRPCLTAYDATGVPLPIGLLVADALGRLELSGLLVSGGPLQIDAPLDALTLTGCTLDPLNASAGSIIANDADDQRSASYLLCRCITGAIRLAAGVGRLTVADSIIDAPGKPAIDSIATTQPVRAVQLERVTLLGQGHCVELQASECILDELFTLEDRQAGCIRYSRYERGSVLPRKFACVPDATTLQAAPADRRCLAPIFDSRHFSRPDYARLATSSPPAIATASEAGSEIGAFTTGQSAIRLENLELKLREYLPVGLAALTLAET